MWEAYVRQFKPKLIAVARPHHLITAGDEVVLDGSRSWSDSAATINYEWQFDDGTTAVGAQVRRAYPKPGCFSEALKVTDAEGNVAYDFAVVQVLDPNPSATLPPMIHAAYWPTQAIAAGDRVTFKVRSFGTTDGTELWDFGDGSERVEVRSDGNVKKLDPNGSELSRREASHRRMIAPETVEREMQGGFHVESTSPLPASSCCF